MRNQSRTVLHDHPEFVHLLRMQSQFVCTAVLQICPLSLNSVYQGLSSRQAKCHLRSDEPSSTLTEKELQVDLKTCNAAVLNPPSSLRCTEIWPSLGTTYTRAQRLWLHCCPPRLQAGSLCGTKSSCSLYQASGSQGPHPLFDLDMVSGSTSGAKC